MSLETLSTQETLDSRPTAPVLGAPTGLTGQLLRFAAVGVASTLAYLGLYALLRLGASPQWANFAALLVTAIANTAANRRLTFGVRGTDGAWRHQIQGLLVFAVGLGLTSGALALLDAVAQQPSRPVELAALIVANLLATAARFLMLRIWVFRSRRNTQPTT
jgi:putative flippase GtrA